MRREVTYHYVNVALSDGEVMSMEVEHPVIKREQGNSNLLGIIALAVPALLGFVTYLG